MANVNLDALIPRGDFRGDASFAGQQKLQYLNLQHLLSKDLSITSIRHLLRKPDFQRETNEWDKVRIAALVKSFIEGQFIPSIILWVNEQTNEIFVIDGAHRLSALIAYFSDDYGDKEISHSFYGYNRISPAEIELAEEAREYVNSHIGSSFMSVMNEPEFSSQADKLRSSTLDIQIVRGDASVAEDSFFKINEQGVVLSPTEKILCKQRELSTCIATRAILRGGTGNQYWKSFTADNQAKVKDIAAEINRLLFSPPHKSPPESAVMDCPLGGHSNTSMAMIYRFVVLVTRKVRGLVPKNDLKGDQTVDILNQVRKLVWFLNSKEAGSLAILPALYVYNSIGIYQPSAFLGFAQFALELRENNQVARFTLVRERFENYILSHKVFVSQFVRKYGSQERPASRLAEYFKIITDGFSNNDSPKMITEKLKHEFNFLNSEENEFDKPRYKSFSKDVKSGRRVVDDIMSCTKCAICGGYIYPYSRSIDHVDDKKFGGAGNFENSASTHPYCNNSKDLLASKGLQVIR